MTDQEYNKQKARLVALRKKWHETLGLKWWKVDYVYVRDDKLEGGESGWSVDARCVVKWEYRDASISFDMDRVSKLSDTDLEKIFVHECCHILVNQMREWAPEEISVERKTIGMKSEESVVTGLAQALLWTREAGHEDRRKR